MLVIDDVSVRFGGLEAISHVSASIGRGEILGLIGPNGSGKTTLLNTISGVNPCATGTVSLDGQSLDGLSPNRVAARGLMRTFQVPRVFATLTVLENMLLPTIDAAASGPHAEVVARAEALLAFVDLQERSGEVASLLSGGQQKLLEFARALMVDPYVVLMDEPFAGVHPRLVQQMTDRILRRRKDGTSFVIVSHEIPPLLEVSDKVLCLNNGVVVCFDEPQCVVEDPDVIAAYLGRAVEDRTRAQRGALDG